MSSNLASPDAVVLCVATMLLPRRSLTCAPATGRESGSITETLISAARAKNVAITKIEKPKSFETREQEKLGSTAHPPLHAKGLMERTSAGLLACESDRGQPSRGAGHSGRPKNCGSLQLPTRVQLRGSAGFSPASLSSSAR